MKLPQVRFRAPLERLPSGILARGLDLINSRLYSTHHKKPGASYKLSAQGFTHDYACLLQTGNKAAYSELRRTCCQFFISPTVFDYL